MSIPARVRTEATRAEEVSATARAAAASGSANWRRTARVSAASQVAAQVGYTLAIPFLPLYMQQLGVHDKAEIALWSGLLSGAAAFPMAIMAPIWGVLADRYGRKLMLVRSLIGGCVLITLMGFAGDVWQLLGLRLLQGAFTGSAPAAAALVAATTPAVELGFALGLVNTGIQIGNSIGPALGGLLVGSLGFRGTFVLGGVLLALATVATVMWTSEPPNRAATSDRREPARDVNSGNVLMRTLRPFGWSRFRSLLVVQVGTQFAFATTWTMLPIYIQEMQRPAWLSTEMAAGVAVTLSAAGAALAMPFFGRVVDERGPKGLMVLSLAGLVLAILPQALIPNLWVVMVMRTVQGVWIAGVTAALGVLTKLFSPPGQEGAAYGATSTAQAFGWGLGPLLGAVVVALAGIQVLYLLAAVVVAVLSVPYLRTARTLSAR